MLAPCAVEQGLLDGGISGGYAAKQQPLVQEGRHLGRMLSRFVGASNSYRGERRIHARRRARTGNVADVHANHAVGEREIIQVIATHEGGRLKFVGGRNTADAQGLRRQHAALMARASSSSSSRSFQWKANQVLELQLAWSCPQGSMYRERSG